MPPNDLQNLLPDIVSVLQTIFCLLLQQTQFWIIKDIIKYIKLFCKKYI